ncbi:plasmalemma vesicle associated protein b [Engraulis encrasicolus]|uniref:plasmalemma vesicle associated protein b n=1 Tax=Engraulis encrasicolus TaxID=184585 RepID=UPI002FD2FF77
MYSTGYPRSTAPFTMQTKSKYKSKSKSCGYYLRIVFFFSSLIQTLIIVSLILFLIYGQPEKSAEEKHVDELSDNFKRVSLDNLALRKDKADLGATIGKMTGEKTALEKDITKLKTDLETSNNNTEVEKLKLGRCIIEKRTVQMTRTPTIQCPPPPKDPNGEVTFYKSMMDLYKRNYTLIVNDLQKELEVAVRARDEHQAAAAAAKTQKEELAEKLKRYTQTCKEDFSKPLEGIREVTGAFLAKIDSVFPHSMTFHITCDKQRALLDGIRNNCTSLSREMEHKYQDYLNGVGNTVAKLQGVRSDLEVQNTRLTSQLNTCTGEASDLRRQMQEQRVASEQKREKDTNEKAKQIQDLTLQLEMQKLHVSMCEAKQRTPALPKPMPPKPPSLPIAMPVGVPGQTG